MVDSYCEGCFFQTYTPNLGWGCDYLLIAGHIRPCQSGYGCTVRLFKKDVGDGSIDSRRAIFQRRKTRTEEEVAAARALKLAKKREYNNAYYWRNRERNLAAQKARREKKKAEKPPEKPPTDQVLKWRSGKARTAAKTKARWQGRQSAVIKGWKLEHGMTYEDMAALLDVDATTVMKWANEANNANWEVLRRIGIEKPEEPTQIDIPAKKC